MPSVIIQSRTFVWFHALLITVCLTRLMLTYWLLFSIRITNTRNTHWCRWLSASVRQRERAHFLLISFNTTTWGWSLMWTKVPTYDPSSGRIGLLGYKSRGVQRHLHLQTFFFFLLLFGILFSRYFHTLFSLSYFYSGVFLHRKTVDCKSRTVRRPSAETNDQLHSSCHSPWTPHGKRTPRSWTVSRRPRWRAATASRSHISLPPPFGSSRLLESLFLLLWKK